MEELDSLISKLNNFTKLLKSTALIIFMCLIVSLILLLFFIQTGERFSSREYFIYRDTGYIIGLINILGLLSLLFHNIYKKRGRIYYDEITDEIEWNYKRKEYYERLPINIRVALKDFLSSEELIFVPSVFGHLIYFIMYLFIIIANILLMKS